MMSNAPSFFRAPKRQSNFLPIYLAFFVLLQGQCGKPERAPYAPVVSQNALWLEEVNRYLSEKEQDILQSYVNRQQLDMRHSPLGYYYQLVEEGRGEQIAMDDVAQLYGSIFLIDGTPCYTYSERYPLEVKVGSFSGITVLNTALLGVRQGSHLRLVVPAYLAFGLLGDGDRIPPRSSLVCDLWVGVVMKKK
ncbi:MAG: FKBP-type peptidyl-prolyl cis-trans isomerase [Prevotellaceae bacterium]|jgi:FKBP-type peptidyl-prolyl cis-trans isomerase|nr:FKBP-type peptidyl-prolyl cis-trans isomerase [Prevotellaceae bacterium]